MGRKALDARDPDKKISVSVSLEQGIIWDLRDQRISPSDLLRTAAMAVRKNAEKKLEDQVEENFRILKNIESEAAVARAQYEKSRSELASWKKQNLEIKLEEDCGAWYLRSLLQEGKISRFEPKVPNLTTLREILEEKGQAVFEKNSRISLSGMTDQHFQDLRRFFGKRGLELKKSGDLVFRPEHFKAKIDLPSGLGPKLQMKLKNFARDFLSGKVSADSLLEDFKEYEPRIISESLKDEVKKSMTPFYLNSDLKQIPKDELIKNAGKKWGEK